MKAGIVVKDVRASVEFYRRLGLDVPDPWEADGVAHHVGVPSAGVDIGSRALTQRYDAGWPDASGVYLFFEVDSREAVDEKFNDITSAGYETHLAPFDAFWGSRYAIVKDPDGTLVGIMSPQDQTHDETPTL